MNKNIPNKANFQKAQNIRNFSNSNDYEQKTTNNELLKTNPNKANFSQPYGWKNCPERSRGTYY
jgi:hypothetical protein